MVGYSDIKQQETYEKLKNRGWYSKWYWHFSNAATTNDNNNDDNSLASTVLLLLTTNESNNCNNYNNSNVLIMKIIIVMHYNGKRLKVVMYIIRLISYSVKKMLLKSMFVIVKVICCF